MQVWLEVFETFYHMSSPCNSITAVRMTSWVLVCPTLCMLHIRFFFILLPKDPPFIVLGTNLLPTYLSSNCYDTSSSLQHTIIFVSHVLGMSLDVFNVHNFAWTWHFEDIRTDVLFGSCARHMLEVLHCILCIL